MPSVEEALIAYLLTVTAVTDLIGAGADMRLYPQVIPQDKSLPAVAYQVISDVPERSQAGFSHLSHARVQLTIKADGYSATKAVQQALFDALESRDQVIEGLRLVSQVSNVGDTFDEQLLSNVKRLDVMIWYGPWAGFWTVAYSAIGGTDQIL